MPSNITFTFREPIQLKLRQYHTEVKLPNKIIRNCDIDGEDASSFELNRELMSRITRYFENSRPGNW